MTLDEAIVLVRKAVKYCGTIEEQKHIDLTVIPAEQRPMYQKALATLQLAVAQGTLTKDDLGHKLHLDY